MVSRTFLIFSFFLLSNYLNCQNSNGESAPLENSSYNSFKAGEWLKFRIHYGIFNASEAILSVKEDTINSEKVYKAIAIGRTTGLARLFFKVEDLYESYFSKNFVRPLISKRNVLEGSYTKNVIVKYDHIKNIATVTDLEKNETNKISIVKNVQDLVSTFYYLRNHFDVKKLKINDFIKITMFIDSENYNFKMKFLGYENLKTKFGEINCLKFRPIVESERIFNNSESLTLWISNDKNKIPIKIKAGLRIGSIDADLEQFKGLRHPFKIKI
jgi:hypothetical protein